MSSGNHIGLRVPAIASRRSQLMFDLSDSSRVRYDEASHSLKHLNESWATITSTRSFRGPGVHYLEFGLKGWKGGAVGVCEAFKQKFTHNANSLPIHGTQGWSHTKAAPWSVSTNGNSLYCQFTSTTTQLPHFSKQNGGTFRLGICIDYFLDKVDMYINGKKALTLAIGIRKFAASGIHAALSLQNCSSTVTILQDPEIPASVRESQEQARRVQDYLMQIEVRLACNQRKMEALLLLDDPSTRRNEILALKRRIAEDQELLKCCDVGDGYIVGSPDIHFDLDDEHDAVDVNGEVSGTNPTH